MGARSLARQNQINRIDAFDCTAAKGAPSMRTIAVKDSSRIFYKDWGKGQPIVFSHGWPLSSDAWDNQMLLHAGGGSSA